MSDMPLYFVYAKNSITVVDLEFSLHSFLCKNKGGGAGEKSWPKIA